MGFLVFQKHCLGPQNGSKSLGPKKMPKIVYYATIRETERNNGGGPSGIGRIPPILT